MKLCRACLRRVYLVQDKDGNQFYVTSTIPRGPARQGGGFLCDPLTAALFVDRMKP